MILFLNCLRFGLVSLLFSSPGVTLASPLILLLLLLVSLILLSLTSFVGIEGAGLVIEVAFLIFLVPLSVEGARMLKISFKPRTATWGLILGQSASFGSFSTSGDPACAVFIFGVCTVCCSDTLGGDASLFGGVVLRLDNISVKASIAAFNLLPVLRNGFAAAGFFNASVSSSKAVDALSADAVVGMLYFLVGRQLYLKLLCLLFLGYRNPSAGSGLVQGRWSIR
jgi:hypothetical protein